MLMTDPAPNLTIHQDLGAGRRKEDRDPVDPPPQKTQVTKQVKQEQPIDGVRRFCYVNFQQDNWVAPGMQRLSSVLDSSEVFIVGIKGLKAA
jgi:hypothetical protein